MDITPIATAAVTAAAGVFTALVGLLIARLPLLLTWARVAINGADAELVRHAIANAAVNQAQAVDGGLPIETAIALMVEYVQGAMPQTVTRLGVSPVTLEAMCRAEMARFLAGRA
jgi:hypothetical protein